MITATVAGIGGFTNTYDDDTNPYLTFAAVDNLVFHSARVLANATGYTYHVTVWGDRHSYSSGPVYSDHVRHCIGYSILPCPAMEAFESAGKVLREQLARAPIPGAQSTRVETVN